MNLRAFWRPVAALSMLLGVPWVTAARADLSVTGGTASQQELLRTAYRAFPRCCQTSCPVCVRLMDTSAMDTCLQELAAAHAQKLMNADAIDGFYQNASPTITLRTPSPTSDVSATFTHEYGHYVWANVLLPAQRDQYRKIYAAQRSTHHLTSQYATVSVEEGFAESFSFYVLHRPILAERDPLSCAFLDQRFTPAGASAIRP